MFRLCSNHTNGVKMNVLINLEEFAVKEREREMYAAEIIRDI